LKPHIAGWRRVVWSALAERSGEDEEASKLPMKYLSQIQALGGFL
jgi:hypothetical protein